MDLTLLRHSIATVAAGSLMLAVAATPVTAAPITWTTWTSGSAHASAGSATGTMGALGVTYAGEMRGFDADNRDWLPVTSFTGGTVDNAPPSGPGVPNDAIILFGGTAGTVNTVTFSAPVLDPVFAIWSLGQGGIQGQFVFTAPFAIQAGGPNQEYGGSSIFTGGTCPVGALCGLEGNGVIQFSGLFTSISWTNPVFENYYTFTVGAPAATAVPEPATMLLVGTGLAAAALRRRRRTTR